MQMINQILLILLVTFVIAIRILQIVLNAQVKMCVCNVKIYL